MSTPMLGCGLIFGDLIAILAGAPRLSALPVAVFAFWMGLER